jgi:hypothetical protein
MFGGVALCLLFFYWLFYFFSFSLCVVMVHNDGSVAQGVVVFSLLHRVSNGEYVFVVFLKEAEDVRSKPVGAMGWVWP